MLGRIPLQGSPRLRQMDRTMPVTSPVRFPAVPPAAPIPGGNVNQPPVQLPQLGNVPGLMPPQPPTGLGMPNMSNRMHQAVLSPLMQPNYGIPQVNPYTAGAARLQPGIGGGPVSSAPVARHMGEGMNTGFGGISNAGVGSATNRGRIGSPVGGTGYFMTPYGGGPRGGPFGGNLGGFGGFGGLYNGFGAFGGFGADPLHNVGGFGTLGGGGGGRTIDEMMAEQMYA